MSDDRTFAEVLPEFEAWAKEQRANEVPISVLGHLLGTLFCIEKLTGRSADPADPLLALLSSLARVAYAEGLRQGGNEI